MKYSEFISELKSAGCRFVRNGGNHDIWYSPITCKKFSVLRHTSKEVDSGLERLMRKQTGVKKK